MEQTQGDGEVEIKAQDWLRAVYEVGYNKALVDVMEHMPDDKTLRDICLDLLHSAKNLSWIKVKEKMEKENINCNIK